VCRDAESPGAYSERASDGRSERRAIARNMVMVQVKVCVRYDVTCVDLMCSFRVTATDGGAISLPPLQQRPWISLPNDFNKGSPTSVWLSEKSHQNPNIDADVAGRSSFPCQRSSLPNKRKGLSTV
jgi:hypothetical protein